MEGYVKFIPDLTGGQRLFCSSNPVAQDSENLPTSYLFSVTYGFIFLNARVDFPSLLRVRASEQGRFPQLFSLDRRGRQGRPSGSEGGG
jgi:hypothetical protein